MFFIFLSNKNKEQDNNIKLENKEIKDNKENEIKLEKEIKNNINIKEEPKYNINDIIVINFNSSDVNYGIKCLADETFAEVEEKLYKRYDNLRETNNMFTVNAKPILRFKKIKENNIKDGDIIQLFKLE